MTKKQYQLIDDQINALEQAAEAQQTQLQNLRALIDYIAEQEDVASQTVMHLTED